jgi:CBS domain-containing protein
MRRRQGRADSTRSASSTSTTTSPEKAGWLAHSLPVERRDELITARQLARTNIVTCRLSDTIGDVAARIADSAYGFALVTSLSGVLLGRLRDGALNIAPDTPAEHATENGPSTVRPDTPADELARRLRACDLTTAIITTPGGELIGIARRADLEEH